jgi:hypothetical protein
MADSYEPLDREHAACHGARIMPSMGNRLVTIACALLLSSAGSAQQCDDFNECTANDMCSEGFCTGTLQPGGCDDGDPCTLNDRCVMDEGFIDCRGDDPAPPGTACAGGCGTCAGTVCVGDPAKNGDPCDPGFANPCVEPACQIVASLAFCLPNIRECPDTDGNPCTLDLCDFDTGQCAASAASSCDPRCETCNPAMGACEPANVGQGCDDFNPCTATSSCQTIDVGGGIRRTFCQAGEPTVPTPTVPPGGCVGDCNGDGRTAVNELIVGVNISLGNADLSQCMAFDTNGNGGVEINELVGAVNGSLNACA